MTSSSAAVCGSRGWLALRAGDELLQVRHTRLGGSAENRFLFLRHTGFYSHSMVEGGLLEMSRATRFTPGTSLMMRLEIRSRTS